MIANAKQERAGYTRWYDEVVRRCLATNNMHPESFPIAGCWRQWHAQGLSPEAALAELHLQLKIECKRG